jgi:hypothetical protein
MGPTDEFGENEGLWGAVKIYWRQAREAESKKEIEMRKTFIAVAAAGLAG